MAWNRYVTVNVDVEVDMRDIETEDLVEELDKRWKKLNGEQKIKMAPYYGEGYKPENLDHKMKFELFLKHIDDYFYTEFEKRVCGEVEQYANVTFDLPEKFIRL
jgi:hypothetical protein